MCKLWDQIVAGFPLLLSKLIVMYVHDFTTWWFSKLRYIPRLKKHANVCQVCRRKNRPKVITLPWFEQFVFLDLLSYRIWRKERACKSSSVASNQVI